MSDTQEYAEIKMLESEIERLQAQNKVLIEQIHDLLAEVESYKQVIKDEYAKREALETRIDELEHQV